MITKKFSHKHHLVSNGENCSLLFMQRVFLFMHFTVASYYSSLTTVVLPQVVASFLRRIIRANPNTCVQIKKHLRVNLGPSRIL